MDHLNIKSAFPVVCESYEGLNITFLVQCAYSEIPALQVKRYILHINWHMYISMDANGIGKQRALSLGIWLSPIMCVILEERQFVALLRRVSEKYKYLNMQMNCECP